MNELARAHVLDRLLVDDECDDDGQYQQHADNHQIGDQRTNDVHNVGHVDLQHGVSPPCFLPNCGIRVRSSSSSINDCAILPCIAVIVWDMSAWLSIGSLRRHILDADDSRVADSHGPHPPTHLSCHFERIICYHIRAHDSSNMT